MVTYYYNLTRTLNIDDSYCLPSLTDRQNVFSNLNDVFCYIRRNMTTNRWNKFEGTLPSRAHIPLPPFLTRNMRTESKWLIITSFCASTIQQLLRDLNKSPVHY
jgi:hypothetical protein